MNINIVCELIPREYENALLLKSELIKRGHSVKIFKKDEEVSLSKCDILLIPNGYNTSDYEWYCKLYGGANSIVISLQYEQVFTIKDEESKYLVPSGKACNAKWLCWGRRPYERMIENGIEKSQLEIVGAIQLDFLRDEFESYWFSKEELSQNYDIDTTREWILFISSFAYVENDFMKDVLNITFGEHSYDNFCSISEQSQKIMLKWFEQYMLENPDVCIIYRPHPIESDSIALKELAKSFPKNFFVISDLSVKQWILKCDKVLTWYSTSIVECFKAGKNCVIARPIEIPENEEVTMLIGARMARTYTEFVSEIDNYNKSDFPISFDQIDYYYKAFEEPTYKLIADYIEKVFKEKREEKIENYENNIHNKFFLLKTMLKFAVKKLYIKWFCYTSLPISNKKIRRKYNLSGLETRAENLKKVDYKKQERDINSIVNMD